MFSNLVKEPELSSPNQAWVSDITYIRTREKFLYSSLITDKYSRKVVGYHVGRTLCAKDTFKALTMALDGRPEGARSIPPFRS